MANVRLILAFLVLVTAPATVAGQSVTIGVEAARDRFTYHFQNPSSFDTPQAVPHFFEQSYVADNIWLVGTVRYTAGIPWETSGGATLSRSLPATDFDTFFEAGGTVVVGTSGDARIHSFRISQRGEVGRAGPVSFAAGYTLRCDRADFLVGHKVIIRNGELIQAFDVTTPELTSSIVQEFFFGAQGGRALGRRWRTTVAGDVSPTTTGRLAVELPDKYPGATLVFAANALTAAGRVSFSRTASRRLVELTVEAMRSWGYSSEQSLTRERLSARFVLGL